MHVWTPPDGHPIDEERAKALMAGDFGNASEEILAKYSAPIFWVSLEKPGEPILHNGTVTFVRTPRRIFAVTAAHVFRQYQDDAKRGKTQLVIGNAPADATLLVDISDKYDLATIAMNKDVLRLIGKEVTPAGYWPPVPPQEGRGIMLGGYPAGLRNQTAQRMVAFGSFAAMGVARRATEVQITWHLEREFVVENKRIAKLPEGYNLGGISGGPMIAWFESPAKVMFPRLAGILTEHPNYGENSFSIERIVAVRADLIDENGMISK